MTAKSTIFLAGLLTSVLDLCAGQRLRAVEDVNVKAVRVQFLSESLVRIVLKGRNIPTFSSAMPERAVSRS